MPDRLRTLCRVLSPVLLLPFVCSALFGQTSYTTVFPQFAGGGGWSSDFFLANQSNSSASVVLSFVGDDGNPLAVDTSLGSGPSFTITLNGGNTGIVRAVSSGALKTGYALLTFPSGASIRGSEVFRYTQDNAAISTLGVAPQFAVTSYSFPAEVDVAHGVNTGIAIANGAFDTSGSVAQSCVVSLVKSDGTLQAVATVPLAAGAHVSEYLNDSSLFPGLDGYSGTVTVSAARPFGLVALRQDQSVFGTVSVDTGPLITPFLLSTSAVNEAEPNNTTGQAQRISLPIVISGNISVPGDADYFQFSGRKGDIVTALVATDPSLSALDSVMVIFNADGSEFAQNDENGLYFSHDSFVQAVLPADGTYFVAVADYSGNGASFYSYRLHIRVLSPTVRSASSKTAGRD